MAKSSVELHGGVVGAIDLRASDGTFRATSLSGNAAYYGSALFLELPLCNMKPLDAPSESEAVADQASDAPKGAYKRKNKV